MFIIFQSVINFKIKIPEICLIYVKFSSGLYKKNKLQYPKFQTFLLHHVKHAVQSKTLLPFVHQLHKVLKFSLENKQNNEKFYLVTKNSF